MDTTFFIKFPIPAHLCVTSQSNFWLIGSCFTEHIGKKLNESGFETAINPFGILFNPVSIHRALQRIVSQAYYSEEELFLTHEKRYVSFDHHGRFSGPDLPGVLETINQSINSAYENLKNADVVIITLGSAWVYRLLSSGNVVANCHKVPAKEFAKSLLTSTEIMSALKGIKDCLKQINPNAKVIWTISPVKHLKDGVVENQISKASLIMAVHHLIEETEDYYFPAYEIVTDELRDYRFFEKDLAHPNLLAVDYVWERFLKTCFFVDALEKAKEAESLNKLLQHKKLHEEVNSESLRKRISDFQKKFPNKLYS
jgi:hypothetical protein